MRYIHKRNEKGDEVHKIASRSAFRAAPGDIFSICMLVNARNPEGRSVSNGHA
jgi:hypothetical protein